ncbi:Alkylhydroperoxidase family enzyme, contains CxxC motif [Malonomonas rubra DSM 5091]|uniref:Alkylhydroperoxidase family enzyme, contains CxxC motif n=1 Tax=Malonomonas rubra DSM 5091 TaxID=1122189 RepID=A0A1M6NK60_MALRU|nr:carboxymuconolactone decarboxylase family protein [Malonomonas rubra]SHJ96158.1 Alkylhydroperoxidase family enzyme, contains CxxC motif [Malonomonas rubra DSM 5091]
MPRIPYLPQDIDEPRELVDDIRSRRRGKLLHLDRMLLHSPAFASGWNSLLRQVRGKLSLSPRLQEMAICAIAVLNGADYEFYHHAPEFLKAGGSEAELDALKKFTGDENELKVFTRGERAVLRLVAEMTLNVQVEDASFAAVKNELPDLQQLNELIGVIASYNMVSRYLVALQIEPEKD